GRRLHRRRQADVTGRRGRRVQGRHRRRCVTDRRRAPRRYRGAAQRAAAGRVPERAHRDPSRAAAVRGNPGATPRRTRRRPEALAATRRAGSSRGGYPIAAERRPGGYLVREPPTRESSCMSRTRRPQAGFTLLELMIVVTLVAIL